MVTALIVHATTADIGAPLDLVVTEKLNMTVSQHGRRLVLMTKYHEESAFPAGANRRAMRRLVIDTIHVTRIAMLTHDLGYFSRESTTPFGTDKEKNATPAIHINKLLRAGLYLLGVVVAVQIASFSLVDNGIG